MQSDTRADTGDAADCTGSFQQDCLTRSQLATPRVIKPFTDEPGVSR